MKIEIKDIEKEYKKTFGNIWSLIGQFLAINFVFFIVIFSFLFSIFYISYYESPPDIFTVNQLINTVFYNWGWMIIALAIIFFCSYFVSMEEKYRCEICNKKDYKENMIILNKAQTKKGMYPKCVCKSHNKPYVKSIKNNW